MIAKLKNGKYILKRARKYTTLYIRYDAVILKKENDYSVLQKWENDYIDRLSEDFESQVKWFEENLKD